LFPSRIFTFTRNSIKTESSIDRKLRNYGLRYAPPVPFKRIKFINRDNELLETWEKMVENYNCRKDSEFHFHFPIAFQVFGSGKSTFGRFLSNFTDEHVKSLYQRVPPSPGKDAFERSVNIHVTLPQDLSMKLLKHLNILPSDLPDFINYLIFDEFISSFYLGKIDPKKIWKLFNQDIVSYDNVLYFIQTVTGKTPLLHFDEIGNLENWSYFMESSDSDSDSERAKLLRYYSFWNEMVNIMRTGSFVYASGRSGILHLLGQNLLRGNSSPSNIHRVLLSAFGRDDVQALVLDKEPQLQENPDQLKLLTEKIFNLSSGVPILVEMCMNYICKVSALLTVDVESILEEKVFEFMTSSNKVRALPDFSLLHPKYQPLLPIIFGAVSNEFKYNLSAKVLSGSFSIRTVIDTFSLHFKQTDNGEVQLIMPLLWRKALSEALPNSLPNPFDIADKRLSLEVAVRSRFLSDLSAPDFLDARASLPISGVYRFFENTVVEDTSLVGLQATYLPSRLRNDPSKQKEALSKLLFQPTPHMIVPGDKSSSADFFISYNQSMIFFHLKNNNPYLGTNPFTLPDLVKEINKSLIYLDSFSQPSPLKVLFILFNTGKYTSPLECLVGKAFGSEQLNELIRKSVSKRNDIKEKKIPTNYKKSKKSPLKLTVKENVELEVLLMSENQMISILGNSEWSSRVSSWKEHLTHSENLKSVEKR
jgi:hypothetical protein